MYISDKPADVENKEYFDTAFKDLDGRQYNDKKQKLFERYVHIDRELRQLQYTHFETHREEMLKRLNGAARVLEIGFGTGEHLYAMLERGVDAYGVDLSVTAVKNFQENHPKYASKVKCGDRFDNQVDAIYCCALLEHLDKPEQFMQDAARCMDRNGLLIVDGVPIVNEGPSKLKPKNDINFWKPCHRAVYSESGLKTLFSRNAFAVMDLVAHDDYYYRVLSLHMKYGYRKIQELRSSCVMDDRLPRFLIYHYICRKALRINSLAYHGCVMLKRN